MTTIEENLLEENWHGEKRIIHLMDLLTYLDNEYYNRKKLLFLFCTILSKALFALFYDIINFIGDGPLILDVVLVSTLFSLWFVT